jgi:hypothetical protein
MRRAARVRDKSAGTKWKREARVLERGRGVYGKGGAGAKPGRSKSAKQGRSKSAPLQLGLSSTL